MQNLATIKEHDEITMNSDAMDSYLLNGQDEPKFNKINMHH